MSWKVGLESYRVNATHGYYDFELEKTQPYVISVWVNVNGAIIEEGDLDATIDYGLLQQIIDEEIVEGKPARLMEEMCRRIIDRLQPFSAISAIKVRIEKPEAPLPHEGGLPIVEMEWNS